VQQGKQQEQYFLAAAAAAAARGDMAQAMGAGVWPDCQGRRIDWLLAAQRLTRQAASNWRRPIDSNIKLLGVFIA